ncbi:MAG TPA: response regulator [Bryobacteraceae bacterium]|nr:response regulator [Bryobacteraceae bacterium]
MASSTCRSPHTILVVEDADAVRRMVCAMLTQVGYRVLEATDGAEAQRLLEEAPAQTVHLVLTDLVMPRMGGSELARYLARNRPGVRILFMSGYADAPMLEEVERTPALFLAKPFTASALADKIREALSGEALP